MSPTDPAVVHASRLGSYASLSMAVAAICVIWLVLLPWIAEQPGMTKQLRELQVRGIDAGAMYYTDLDAMAPILKRLERPSQLPTQ